MTVDFGGPVDLEAVRDMQRAIAVDDAWRKAGGPLRIKAPRMPPIRGDSIEASPTDLLVALRSAT